MESRALTNVLLLLVAFCLVLITLRMYSVIPEASAVGVQAKAMAASAVVGCYSQFFNQCEYRYIRVNDEGFLLTATK